MLRHLLAHGADPESVNAALEALDRMPPELAADVFLQAAPELLENGALVRVRGKG
jgi:hypothetical protein